MAVMDFSGKVSHFAVIIKKHNSKRCLNCEEYRITTWEHSLANYVF